VFKKVFATVTEKEFNIFREKCYLNMIKMGDCLSELIRDYIAANQTVHENEHHESTGADYKKEHIK